ncbi:MAG: hypothetical protein AAF969_14800 [Bacteroidota bacterium]
MKHFVQNFIAPVYHLTIKEDLGRGLKIDENVYITNNDEVKRSFISDPLKHNIGALETVSLENCNVFFYSTIETNSEKLIEDTILRHRTILLNFIYKCEGFLTKLWIVKDNACTIDKGFLEVFEVLPMDRMKTFFTTSNYIGMVNTLSGGEIKETEYSKKEIENALHIFSSFRFRDFEETFNEDDLSSKYNEENRVGLSLSFLSEIRPQHNLGIKISNFCSLFESLFSTSSNELVHKLSERIAYFLEHRPEKRLETYRKIKELYTVRSLIVHGAGINKKRHTKLAGYSEQADDITRRFLHKILRSRELLNTFTKHENKDLEDYLNLMVFGKRLKK